MIRLAACAILSSALMSAPVAVADGGGSFALRAGKLYPVADGQPHVIDDAVLIVREGRIEAVGPAGAIEIPVDLPVLDFSEATVMPGLVAAASPLAGAHNGEESISGLYHAVDAFDRYGDFEELLASGVTAVHLDPGAHRLVSGRGAVVRLGGYHDERVLRDGSDLAINLGPGVLNPPDIPQYLIPPSGDQPMEPSIVQRPSTRMGQYLALREALAAKPEAFDPHLAAFQEAWSANLPLRITSQHSNDIAGAVRFLKSQNRAGCIVGGIEMLDVLDLLRDAQVPLVYTIDTPLRTTQRNLGENPDVLEGDIDQLRQLEGVRFALAPTRDIGLDDLRVLAATAMRGGVSEEAALRAVTRSAAEIIGVGDRIGSLEPGKDADFLIMSGPPLATQAHVNRAYISGRLVYRSDRRSDDRADAVVVRGGSVWLGPDNWLEDGSVLIEDGRIVSVGRSVPHPPGARVIDGGDDSFITPGLIDAHGHLGLQGDRSQLQPQLSLEWLVGAAGVEDLRVARSGVTTILTAPYSFHNHGSQITAIKTAGSDRDDRVLERTSALAFSVSGMDPTAISGHFKQRIDAGNQYLEKWKKYEEDLEAWKKARAEGRAVKPEQPQAEETEAPTPGAADPITGTWSARVFGGPLPQEFEGRIALRLTGTQIEGRIVEPEVPVEVRIIGTLNGQSVSGTIDVDTGGMGMPQWTGQLSGEDLMTGTISVQMFTVNFEARRTDKGPVEFKVTRARRRTVGKDGRPLPPKVDDALEPVRAWLEKRIPALVAVSSWQEIDAVLDYLVEEHSLPVVLLNANDAKVRAERLREKEVGVIVPAEIVRREDDSPYHQADDLSRRGVSVAFQSDAEDGARLLPLLALHAVERGMSPEQALAALTIDAAAMYKVDDRVGSIAPGRDGDLVIFSGHPFEASSRILRVIVNGEEVKN